MEERNDSLTIPVKDLRDAEPLDVAREIIRILDRRKADDIRLLHVTEKTILANYFVLCSGNSNTQVRGLAGEVEYRIGLDGVTPTRIEGEDSANWIILDYASILVHIFKRDSREFYNLDRLWADAEEVDISDILIDESNSNPNTKEQF